MQLEIVTSYIKNIGHLWIALGDRIHRDYEDYMLSIMFDGMDSVGSALAFHLARSFSHSFHLKRRKLVLWLLCDR